MAVLDVAVSRGSLVVHVSPPVIQRLRLLVYGSSSDRLLARSAAFRLTQAGLWHFGTTVCTTTRARLAARRLITVGSISSGRSLPHRRRPLPSDGHVPRPPHPRTVLLCKSANAGSLPYTEPSDSMWSTADMRAVTADAATTVLVLEMFIVVLVPHCGAGGGGHGAVLRLAACQHGNRHRRAAARGRHAR